MLQSWNKLTSLSKILLGLLVAAPLAFAVYYFAPGLRVEASKKLDGLTVSGDAVDNVEKTDMLPLPGTGIASTNNKPLVKFAGYAWNGQSALAAANGGPRTTSGSLMEKNGVNLEIVRQDWLKNLIENEFLTFVEEYDKQSKENPGQKVYPTKGSAGIIIMGDGVPYAISAIQKTLNEKYNGKYHAVAIGAIGASNGEDKLIGPAAWKDNPKLMKGSLISTVVGDGDWVTSVNYAFSNGLNVNPDPSTYDAQAVNFYPSEEDDYMKSAEELIKSQTGTFTVKLDVVKDGVRTGEEIVKKIDACATWTPGDKVVFDALTGFTDITSTKDFPNQMATTIILFQEWGMQNVDIVSNILKSSYTAANQIKQHDVWARKAAECIDKTFKIENTGPEYWYKMFKGQKGTKNGITYNMGGTRVFTLADAKQYYGMGSDRNNRYKSVYEQVSKYLTDLNPANFKGNVGKVVPFSEAFTPVFINSIFDTEEGQKDEFTYENEATEIMASGAWQINFTSGSANFLKNAKTNNDLISIYNLLVQAEQAKLEIVGHTDSDGDDELNLSLSKARAQSVVDYLKKRGISADRFQLVDGRGESEPVSDNATAKGKALNRRVQITLKQ